MFLTKRYLNYMLTTLAIIVLSFAMIETGEAKFDENTIQGMWTFEEGEGKTVTDLSENGSDGEFVGDVKWAKAKFGGGIELSGVEAQNYVRIGTKGDSDSLAALNFKDAKVSRSMHGYLQRHHPMENVLYQINRIYLVLLESGAVRNRIYRDESR